MKDPDGKFYCDGCGRRSHRGGFNITLLGTQIQPRLLKVGKDTIDCSEGCLRDALFGLAGVDDPLEELRRKVDRQNKQLKRLQRQTDDESEADQMWEVLQKIQGTISQIRTQELTRSIDKSDEGRTLGRCISAIEQTVRGFERFSFYRLER